MMLARTAEHALRAMLYLAQQPAGRPTPANRIADAIGAPADYLSKALQGLAAAGLVRGTRGRNGGYILAASPASVSVADITRAFAADAETDRCLLGDRPCSPATPCDAHIRWSSAQLAARACIGSITIAQLVPNGTPQ